MSKTRFWLLLLILIALAIRLTLLGEQSLWYDEGVTWLLSQMQFQDLISWTAADIQPPLYYLLIWSTDFIFGDSEWALRFPSAVFSMLTVPLIYTLARRLFTSVPVREGVPASPAASPPHTTTSLSQAICFRPAGHRPTPYTAAVPLLTAALFTSSPLMIYYSQEARMYTLLAFEATLSSYLLLKILHPALTGSRPNAWHLPRAGWLYALVAGAALYTHYLAVFLIVAHGLYALYILWQQRFQKYYLARLSVSFGGTLLLYAPWLPTLFARLEDDPSYWPGALKINEVLRDVLISFVAGETVFEQTGWWLVLIYFGFLILAFGLQFVVAKPDPSNLGASNPQPRLRVGPFPNLFLLLWLVLPLILILVLTYQSPKFNPRYILLAWPALALITAVTLARLLEIQSAHPSFPKQLATSNDAGSTETGRQTDDVLQPRSRAARFLFVLFTLFILTSTAFSLFNWFTDPRFSKDDFKALAQFVRERQAADETVLLSSGHLFPVWAYYYGWQGWTPLPWMLRLNVNQITDLSIAGDIAEAITGSEGVWLVTWQDEVIDPNGVVPFWLDLIGRRPDDAGDFWGVGLEHWRLDAGKIDLLQEDPIKRPVSFTGSTSRQQDAAPAYNFANQVDLLGYTQLSNTNLALFWRPRQPLPDNLVTTLRLTDSDGFTWSRETVIGRPGAYLYPPSRWPVGQIVMIQHQLPWQIGTPPGLYMVEIGVGTTGAQAGNSITANVVSGFVGWDVLDEQGRPQRRTALLDFVNLSHLVEPESGPLSQDESPVVDFFPILGLRRSILPQTSARPGDRILLALLWQAGEYNLDNVSLTFDLVDAQGQVHRVGSSYTPSRNFNLPTWNPGDMVLGQYWLDIPPNLAPGVASLQLHIINVSGYAYDETFDFDEIEILPTERNFSAPDAVDIPVGITFSDQVTLIGADCPTNCRARPGQSITLTLYWQVEATFDLNYTIFTHLLGPDQSVLINADHSPPKPTQGWVPNEIIADTVTLTIPAGLPRGDYNLEVGLYDATDPAFQRLPVDTGETRVILPQSLTVN